MYLRLLVWALLLPVFFHSFGQESPQVRVFVDGVLREELFPDDNLKRHQFIRSQLLDFWQKGYAFGRVDSTTANALYLHAGTRFKGEVRVQVYNEQERTYEAVTAQPNRFIQAIEPYLNQGFPFAALICDSVRFESSGDYTSYCTIQPGPYITLDSLVLLSPVGVSRGFLLNTMNLEKNEPFSEREYRRISQRLEQWPFLKLKQPPDVAFEGSGYNLYLDLVEESANSFEGIIGLLPGQSSIQRTLLTGYIDLSLANLFRSGKELGLIWNRFADASQSIDLQYFHPYFLSSRLYFRSRFQLIRQDTTFLSQSWRLATGTYLANGLEAQVSYERSNGSLISVSERALAAGLADYRTDFYGISLQSPNYDQEFGVANGIRFGINLELGDRRIRINPELPRSAYDTLTSRMSTWRFTSGIKYQVTLRGATRLFHQVSGGSITNTQALRNELFRMGGLKTIRGFNENFFFLQHYAVSRLELRQYFERNSFMMLFYDQLVYESGYPAGLGVGLSLNTTNGLFTFALASGISGGTSLSEPKVHLGYTSRF